jgi:hypothetical protein
MEVDAPVSEPPRPAPTVILGARLLGELDKLMCAEGADAIVHLYNWHCCGRCILRLLSIRVIELYKQTELVRFWSYSSIKCNLKSQIPFTTLICIRN